VNRSARIAAIALAAVDVFAIGGASVLVGALGGNWLAVLATAVALLVLSAIAFVLLAMQGKESADDPTDEGPEILATYPDGEPKGYDDRDRWAS
jgi:hypothetical protein